MSRSQLHRPFVVAASLGLIIPQIEQALEVWFGMRFHPVKYEFFPGNVTVNRKNKDDPIRERSVRVNAFFRPQGALPQINVKCIVTVRCVWNDFWTIKTGPVELFIDESTYIVEWQEPVGSVCEPINVNVTKDNVTWHGLAYNERWELNKTSAKPKAA